MPISKYGSSAVEGVGIGQDAVLALPEHVRYQTVRQQVYADIAHAARERKAEHHGICARSYVRYQPRAKRGRAKKHQPRRKGIYLVESFAEKAQYNSRRETAEGLHCQNSAVFDLVYAEIGHSGLGVCAEAVAVHAV